jgi:membrane-bound lytic murein transglycosylase B
MARHRSEPASGSGEREQTRALGLDLRRAAAAVPVLVLLASGVAVAGDLPRTRASSAGTGAAFEADQASTDEALPRVPDDAITAPASVAGPDGVVAPGLELPPPVSADGAPGSGRVSLDGNGIPSRALQAYRHAAALLGKADPACRLDWSLVAAIGRVESNHGSFGGNALGSDGVARPGIIGIALDGTRGTASIPDSDGGAHDRDTAWDRAVGPMQFIPGTWRAAGSDAEPDGARNPQDIDDAAAATGVYLCSGTGDLTVTADRYRAIRRYNNSDSYVRTVMTIANAYASGVREVRASALPAARTAQPAQPAQPAQERPAPPPAPSGDQGRPPQEQPGGNDPTPAPRPAPTPPVQAGGPVGAVAGAVTGAVTGAVGTPPPAPAPAPLPLPVDTAPLLGQQCVDPVTRQPVPLLPLLGLCPAGNLLLPLP